MLYQKRRWWLLRTMSFVFALFLLASLVWAQSPPLPEDDPDCTPERLANQQDVFAQILTFDFDRTPLSSRDNLFRLGAVYQQLAIDCGYVPSEQELNALINLTLTVTNVETILAANAVGEDIAVIMEELEEVRGDSFNGQLLYTGTEPVLDGSTLGCAGCHEGETAPPLEGTYTRVEEIRLQEDVFAGYTIRQYLVESIIHPNDYIAPDYVENLMPTNYGNRMDIQQLADLIAYLESQDQLLGE
jgi:hypothetical protein